MWHGLFWAWSVFFGAGWQLEKSESQELGDCTADVAEDLPDPVVAALDTYAKPVRLVTTFGAIVGKRVTAAAAYADAQTMHTTPAPPAMATPAAHVDPLNRSAPAPAAPPAARTRTTESAAPAPDPVAAAQEPYLKVVPQDPFTHAAMS